MNMSLETRAKLVCLYAGAVWGVFWIPLRQLETAELHGLWLIPIYFLVPVLFLLPVLFWRWRGFWRAGWHFHLTVIFSGAALTLYSVSIVYTDVIRALLLFYLMPIWSVIMARIFLGEPVTPIRIMAIGMAVTGMLVMFGLGIRFPVPQNIGDWMGLLAGVFWAITMVRLRIYDKFSSVDLTAGFFLWGLIISVSIALWIVPSHLPSLDQVTPALPLLIIFVLLLVIPGTYASLWGPKFLDPGVSSLLFLMDVVVGAISAALLTAEAFGGREMAGIALIVGASLLDPLSAFFPGRSKRK